MKGALSLFKEFFDLKKTFNTLGHCNLKRIGKKSIRTKVIELIKTVAFFTADSELPSLLLYMLRHEILQSDGKHM